MKKDGVACRRAELYEKIAKEFLDEYEKLSGFSILSKYELQ